MRASRFNILSRVEGSDDHIIVNLLSGQADLITPEEAEGLASPRGSFAERCLEKGYLADPVREEMLYRLRFIDFLEKRNQEEVQVFFVPTYTCNFSCSYCYQSAYNRAPAKLSAEVFDGFFRFLDVQLAGRRHYITLFGGEPLLPSPSYRASLSAFIERCGQRGVELAIVTNGYHLDSYFSTLKGAAIREIQLTLDGTRAVHDARRPLKGGKPSFDVVVSNLEECLELGYPVNLRVVLDRENIGNLPALAAYAVEKGWTRHPLFKTQLGRNYELHHCQTGNHSLYSRIDLYKDLYHLIQQYPEITEFHRPAFSVTKFLFDNGRLPDPLFDACPACKSEWALDHYGTIYPCTATVGKAGEEVGSFHPALVLDQEAVRAWQGRDVAAIKECQDCALQLACGGGCGSLAKNRNGNLLSPDCRPVKDLIGLGAAVYFS